MPLVAEKILDNGVAIISLNFYPVSTAVSVDGTWDVSTDGARLMGNALLYAARRHISNSRQHSSSEKVSLLDRFRNLAK